VGVVLDIEKELELEEKYLPVLSFVETGKLLAAYKIESGKIRGALTSFCKKEEYDRPETFVEMETDFTPDFMDWWLSTAPKFHKRLNDNGTRIAVNKYLAFTNVWKSKFLNNQILTDPHIVQAGTMLAVKGSLSASLRAWLSYNKRIEKLEQSEIKDVLPELFYTILPFIHQIQTGVIDLPNKTRIDDASRLLGAFFAGDASAVGLSERLKQIEYKKEAA